MAEGKTFDGGDNLWKSFQDKIQSYVTTNGGMASKNAPIIGRLDWATVADVLNGNQPVSSLGCK